MSERSNFRSYSEDLAKTPGPARYSATHNEVYLKRNPQEHRRFYYARAFHLIMLFNIEQKWHNRFHVQRHSELLHFFVDRQC